jgi:hypothetical protein
MCALCELGDDEIPDGVVVILAAHEVLGGGRRFANWVDEQRAALMRADTAERLGVPQSLVDEALYRFNEHAEKARQMVRSGVDVTVAVVVSDQPDE